MKRDITIIVAGHAATGKSALAQEIAAALRQCGFPVNHKNPEHPPRGRETQMQIIDATRRRMLEEGALIYVTEEHLKRRAHGDEPPLTRARIREMLGTTELHIAMEESMDRLRRAHNRNQPSRRYEVTQADDTEGGDHD